ncbi:hypothetical protein HNV08_00575 [Winogradskyella eckloniae]|uniref:hypothetical protein n=1 Tax=Winogradskyella eckloniae TaxID=1089306 RepID=UPI001563B2BF|nr:hypothetical protein [Winogradskyella eckloniae]NRD18524.1 hypothetical protein [Winogradskyella eckloniae]
MKLISKIARVFNEKLSKNNSLAYLVYLILPNNNVILGREYRRIKRSISLVAPPQLDSLKSMLNFVVNNVPFYSDQNTIKYKDFPFINKKIIVDEEEHFFSKVYKSRDYEVVTSGGTTGIPAKYYSPKNRYKKEYAYFHFLWEKLGYTNQLRAVLRNTSLSEDRDYKINPITREVVFDAFRNTDLYFMQIYKIIKKLKINYLQAYPSSAYNFLNFCYQKSLDLKFLKGVFLSSESYLEYQQLLFEKKLNLKVISVYGHSERLILIYRDFATGEHKVLHQYGFFDLVDTNGNSITEENIVGEIVGTSLDNFGYPLINYKTGDYTSYKKYNSNGECTLNEILSRREDLRIYNKDESYVSPTALNMHGEFYTKIKGLQYFQKTKGKLKIKIIKSNTYRYEDELFLINFMTERFSPTTEITIEYVHKLKTTNSGKNLLLESKIEY